MNANDSLFKSAMDNSLISHLRGARWVSAGIIGLGWRACQVFEVISLSADPVIKLPEERRVKMARLGPLSLKGRVGGEGPPAQERWEERCRNKRPLTHSAARKAPELALKRGSSQVLLHIIWLVPDEPITRCRFVSTGRTWSDRWASDPTGR